MLSIPVYPIYLIKLTVQLKTPKDTGPWGRKGKRLKRHRRCVCYRDSLNSVFFFLLFFKWWGGVPVIFRTPRSAYLPGQSWERISSIVKDNNAPSKYKTIRSRCIQCLWMEPTIYWLSHDTNEACHDVSYSSFLFIFHISLYMSCLCRVK